MKPVTSANQVILLENPLNKKPRGFMQSCFPLFVYFECLSEFLLYFYKCSTSMAFTKHWPLALILYRCKFRSILY